MGWWGNAKREQFVYFKTFFMAAPGVLMNRTDQTAESGGLGGLAGPSTPDSLMAKPNGLDVQDQTGRPGQQDGTYRHRRPRINLGTALKLCVRTRVLSQPMEIVASRSDRSDCDDSCAHNADDEKP